MSQQQNLRPPDLNLVIISGRIVRDAEVRFTASGMAVCTFTVAMSRRMRDQSTGEWKDADPVFVPVVVFAEAAQRCEGRANKGAPVFIEGRLQTNKWEDKETKKPMSRLELIASRVQFLTIKSAQGAAPQSQTSEPAAIGAKASDEPSDYQSNQASSPKQSFADDDEDIPF